MAAVGLTGSRRLALATSGTLGSALAPKEAADQRTKPGSAPAKGTDVSDYQTIRYERDQHVGTLTLARPDKRNAQNPLMWQELACLGAELLPDQTLRCLVVAGEGPSFSAGIDLVEGLAGMVTELTGRLHDEDAVQLGLTVAGTVFGERARCATRRSTAIGGPRSAAGDRDSVVQRSRLQPHGCRRTADPLPCLIRLQGSAAGDERGPAA